MRNALKNNEKNKAGTGSGTTGSKHQALKAKLLGRKKNGRAADASTASVASPSRGDRSHPAQQQQQQPVGVSLLSKSIKSRIREVLELKHLPTLMDNRISVIRPTTAAITNQDYYAQESPIDFAMNKPRSVAV